MKLKSFPHYQQLDSFDCGPTCLKMIAEYYGRRISLPFLRQKSYLNRTGVSLMGISQAAEEIGIRTMSVKANWTNFAEQVPLPCIVHWNQRHFVIVYKIHKDKVYVADPAANSLLVYKKEEFMKCWLSSSIDGSTGIAMLLEPGPKFYDREPDDQSKAGDWLHLLGYFRPHTAFLIQLLCGLLAANLLQLVFPFLTQAIVDIGIHTRNLNFIYLVLIAQLCLFVARIFGDFLRAWILLYLSTHINLALVTDFLIKLLKLPLSFFQQKNSGDIIQRIQDQQRIQTFLSGQSMQVLFSLFNLVVFGSILAFYNRLIFLVFLIGSILYLVWLLLFLSKRRTLDYKNFQLASNRQNNLMELVQGIEEIKLNNAETLSRWEWERIQVKTFRLQMKGTALQQYQTGGSLAINELKNILITFLAAQAVIEGSLTLGMMLSVQYILGQLQAPVAEMGQLMHQWQDARISLERMDEINKEADEYNPEQHFVQTISSNGKKETQDLMIQNLSFQYSGPSSPKVLDDISFEIPKGKITAIVGTSGSGKSTLLKLLLKFYNPTEGEIYWGKHKFKQVIPEQWRQICGSVMQEGFIFSKTIAENIAIGEDNIDHEKLIEAAVTANIHDFIDELPLGYSTKIGAAGVGISGGQKQRLLIARAVYKNPQYLFFDEATSSLEANNESLIMGNLQTFFQGKTVVIVAHRLSTVKNADQILVIEKGKLIEQGDHNSLAQQKGRYFDLVKNQLELGD